MQLKKKQKQNGMRILIEYTERQPMIILGVDNMIDITHSFWSWWLHPMGALSMSLSLCAEATDNLNPSMDK